MVVSERRNGGVPLFEPSKNISDSQMCFINNNRALVIARNVLLVDNQEI